jgi:hypothetical protein
MTYTAYLRIYGPVWACHEPGRPRRAGYAAPPGRPRRCRLQPTAEIHAAIGGAARGERELALAMYVRARSRWRALADFERAN